MLNQAVVDGGLYNFLQMPDCIYYRSLCEFEVDPQVKVISGNKVWGEGLKRYITDIIFFTQESFEVVQGDTISLVCLQSTADAYGFPEAFIACLKMPDQRFLLE